MESPSNSNILRNYKKSVEDLKRVKTSAFKLNLQTGTEHYQKMSPANGVGKNDAKYTISHDESEIFSNSNNSDANLFSDNRPFLCDSRTFYSKHGSHGKHSSLSSYSIQDNHFKRAADMTKQKITKDKHESNNFSVKAHLNVKNKFVRSNSAAKYRMNLNKSLDKISKIRIMQKFRRNIHSHSNERAEHRIGTFEHSNLFDKHTALDSSKATTISNSNSNMKFKHFYHSRLDSTSTCDREVGTNRKNVYQYKSNSFHDNPQNSIKKYLNEAAKQNGKDINSNFPPSNQIKRKPTVIPSNIISLSTKHTAIFSGKTKFPPYFHPVNHSKKLKIVSNPHLNNNTHCDKGNYANIKMGNNLPDGNAFQKGNFLQKNDLTFGVNKQMEHLNLSHYLSSHIQGGKSVSPKHNIAEDSKRKDQLINNKSANWNDLVIQFMNEYMHKKQYLQNLQKFNDGLKNNPAGKANPLFSNFSLRHSFDMSTNSNVAKNNKSTYNNYFKKTVESKITKSKLYENYVDFEKEFRDKTNMPNVVNKTNEQSAVLFAQNICDEKLHPHNPFSKSNGKAKRTLSSVGAKRGVVKSEPLKTCGNACKKQEVPKVSAHIINIPINFKLKKKKIINYKNIIQDTSSKKEHNYTNALLTDRYRNFLNMEKEQNPPKQQKQQKQQNQRKQQNQPKQQKQQNQQNSNFNDKAEFFDKGEFLSSFLKKDLHNEQCMHVEKLFNSDMDDTMSNQGGEQAKREGEDKTHEKREHADHHADSASAQLGQNIAHMEKQRENNSTSDLSTHIGACGQEMHAQEQLHEQQLEQFAGLREKNGDHENEAEKLYQTTPELTQIFSKKGNIQTAEFSARNILETQNLEEQNDPREIEQQAVNPAIFEQEKREEECLDSKKGTCKGSDEEKEKKKEEIKEEEKEEEKEELDVPINWEVFNDIYSSNTDNEAALKSCAKGDDQEPHSLGRSSSIQNDGTSESTISKFLKEENMDEEDAYEYEPGASEQDVEMGVEKGYYSAQSYHTNGGNKYASNERGTVDEDKKRLSVDLQHEGQITTEEEKEKKEESVQGECFKNASEEKNSTPEDEEAKSEMSKKDQKRTINDDITKGETDKSNSLSSHCDVEHFHSPTEDDAKEELSATNFKQQNDRNGSAFLNDKIEAEQEELTLEGIRALFQTECTEEAANEEKEKKEPTQNGYTTQDESAIRTNNNDCVHDQDEEKPKPYETEQERSPNRHENREDEVFTYKQEIKMEQKSDSEETKGDCEETKCDFDEPKSDSDEPKGIEMEKEDMHKGDNTEECKQKKDSNEFEKGEQAESGHNACIGETLNEAIRYANETNGEQNENEKNGEMDYENYKESNRDLSEMDIPIGRIAPENDDESSGDQRVIKNNDIRESTTPKGTNTQGGSNLVTPNDYALVKAEFNEKDIYPPIQMPNNDNVNEEIAHIDLNKVTSGETITGCNPLCIEINKHELFRQLHIKENRLRYVNFLYHSFDYDKGALSKERGNGPQKERRNGPRIGPRNDAKNEISACSSDGTKKDRTNSDAHITHFEEKVRRIFNPAQGQNGVVHQSSSNMQSTRNATNEPLNEKIDSQMEGNKPSDSNMLRGREQGGVTLQNDPILPNKETEMVKEKGIKTEDKQYSVSDEKNKDHFMYHLIDHTINHSSDDTDGDSDDDSDENADEKNILYEDIKRNLWLQNTNLSESGVQYIQVESVKCIMLFCYLYKIKYFQGLHDMIISLFYLNLQPYEILCVFERILHYYAPYLYLQNSCMYSSPRIFASTYEDTISGAISNITMQICNTNGKLFRLLFQYFFPYVSYYVDTAVSDTWPSLFFLNLSFSKFDNVFCLLYLWVRLIQMKNKTSEVTCDFIIFILSFCMHKLRMVKREFYEKRGLTSMFMNSTYALPRGSKKRDEKYTQGQTEKCSHKVIKQVHGDPSNCKMDERKGDDERQATHEESGKQADNQTDNKIHHPMQTRRKYTQKGEEKMKEIIRKIKLSTYSSEMFSLFFEFSSSFDDHFGDKYKMHIDCIINDIPKIRDIIPVSFLQFLTKYNSAYQKKRNNKNSSNVKNLYGYTQNEALLNSLTPPPDDHLCLHIKLSDLFFIHNNVEGYDFVFLRLVKCQIILSKLILINPGNLVIENFARFKNVDEFVKHKKKLHIPGKSGRTMYIVLLCSQENNAKWKDWNVHSNDRNMHSSDRKFSSNGRNVHSNDRYMHKHKTNTASKEKNGSQNVYSNRVFFKRNNKRKYMCSEHSCEFPVDNAYLKNLITTLVKNNFKRLTILKEHPKAVKIKNKKKITEKETKDRKSPVKENSFFFQMFNIVKKKIYQNIRKDTESNKNTPPQSNQPQNNNTKFAVKENNIKMSNERRIRKRINYSNRKPVLYSKNVMQKSKYENPPKKLNNDAPNGLSGRMQNKADKKIQLFLLKFRKRNESKRLVHGFKTIGKGMNLTFGLFPKPYVDPLNNRSNLRKGCVHRRRPKQKKSFFRILKKREINLEKNKPHSNKSSLPNRTDAQDKIDTRMHINKTNYNQKKNFIFINRGQFDDNTRERERKNASKDKKTTFSELRDNFLNDFLSKRLSPMKDRESYEKKYANTKVDANARKRNPSKGRESHSSEDK
ncbi:hypothetical protein PVIIG_01841 [Plasmodium vivax India VII]|uniref:Uncharacterized protein n=1 Tax=Plasmodium vivax India VII TaxID=1077284 RepID=A0A0J9SBJ9_PLAVI|nr:hypothetical protein PVIIG_01841 [Plasmodium vivax India VII]